jgi:hypothetical protein
MKNVWVKLQWLLWLGATILSCSGSNNSMLGSWKWVPDKSTNIQTWNYRSLEIEIRQESENTMILQKWLERDKIAFIDSVAFTPGKITEIPVTSYIWPENWYMGVLSKINTVRKVSGKWTAPDCVTTEIEQVVEISQGDAIVTTIREFSLNRDGNELTLIEKRSTRPAPIKLVFERVR